MSRTQFWPGKGGGGGGRNKLNNLQKFKCLRGCLVGQEGGGC